MAMPQRDDTIEAIKRRAVEKKAAVSVNSALLVFYWNLGKDISEKYAATQYYGSRAMRLIKKNEQVHSRRARRASTRFG